METNLDPLRAYVEWDKARRQRAHAAAVAALHSCAENVSDEALNALLQLEPGMAYQVLKHHPGYRVWARIESVRAALDVFRQAVRDLEAVLESYHMDSGAREFHARQNREAVEALVLGVHKEVFSASSAAKALIDHARRLNGAVALDGYDERRQILASDAQAFIIDLRNALSHQVWMKPSAGVIFGNDGRTTRFSYSKLSLLSHGDWNSRSKRYIESCREINVGRLFKAYLNDIEDFYGWWLPAVEERLPAPTADYLRCRREIEVSTYRQSQRFFLTVWREQKVDPYDHLAMFLTQEQLNRVSELPHRSKEQVDMIIDFADELGACNDELRRLTYRLFGVPEPDNY